MLTRSIILAFFLLCIIYPIQNEAVAACDSGTAPRTGSSLTVTVNAGTPNGGSAVDAVFTYAFNSKGSACNCGQFANGDYWIAPADGETEVTITSIETTSAGGISADADPILESMGLLDGSKNYGNYDPDENITLSLPATYTNTTSIVTAIKRNEAAEGKCGTGFIVGECVDAYNVLTVLPRVPDKAGSDMIRPNITGRTKETLTLSDFDFSRIPSKSFLKGTNAAGLEKIRQRWSHSSEIFSLKSSKFKATNVEWMRAFRSHVLIDDYGAGVARQFNDDLMTLFSDDNTLSEKQSAIAAIITYGLDLYHAIYDAPEGTTRYWGVGATQHSGKFLPPVFFAALAKNIIYSNNLSTVSSHVHDSVNHGPEELAQIHDGINFPVWGDTPAYQGKNFQGGYWGALKKSQCYDGATGVCCADDPNDAYPCPGAKTQADPNGYIDGPPNIPGSNYMVTSLGVMRSFAAVMYLMPEVKRIVNYPQLLVYVDRLHNYGLKTKDDKCVTPDARELDSCSPWDNTGCAYYGVTWGPIDPNNPDSHCITTPTPPYTKVGRFTELDGTKIEAYYTSRQVEDNWELIHSAISKPYNLRILDVAYSY